MHRCKKRWLLVALIVGGGIFALACSTCGLIPGLGGTATPTPPPPLPARATPTPTPTPAPVMGATATAVPNNRCAGLSASLEVQILAGPAAAVGLEPFAVGSVPLTVSGQAPYAVSGSGPISYDQTLTENWGTYQVTMDMVLTVSGACQGESEPGTLQLHIEGSGSQLLEVKADQFHGTYPWEGSYAFDLSFPIEEGASAEGEGWGFVLHVQ
jgi:hypothetical protein